MPTFRDISSEESLWGPPNICGNLLPLRLVPLEAAVRSPEQLHKLLASYKGSKYLLALQGGERIPWWDARERFLAGYRAAPHIAVSLAADARPRDILTAVLEAAYLRQQLLQQRRDALALQLAAQQPCMCSPSSSASSSGRGSQSCGCGGSSLQPQRQELQQQQQQQQQQLHRSGAGSNGACCQRCGGSTSTSSSSSSSSSSIGPPQRLLIEALSIQEELAVGSSMRKQAKRQAEGSVGRFLHELQAEGWQTRTFLLSTNERVGFTKF
jgi:hypothetical protein